MKVLIADKFESFGVSGLEMLGCDVTHNPDIDPAALPAAIQEHDPDVLVVRGKKVSGEALRAGSNLSLVIRAGAGYDSIDVDTASARGIFVANCPGKNSIAVAELTWGLILACDRRIPDQVAELRDGKWNKKEYSKASGLAGRTLGIVGMGQIGLEITKRGKAFGMHVAAWSRSLTEERADELGIIYCSNIINLAKLADVVSVNVAATDETQNLIGEAFFGAMKNDAYFINTSRGSVVDEEALVEAIREKKLRAGLDVFANEPGSGTGSFDATIARMPGVYGTHHIGASTDQAQQAIAAEVIRIARDYMVTGHVPNCVNRAASTPATTLLTVRHLNRPGVLAHIFYILGQAGINVEEMENVIYESAKAACARIQLDDKPGEDVIKAVGKNENVLSVTVATIRKADLREPAVAR